MFRVFRKVNEEQRKMSEGRYRSVLLEAVQDAVYLSAQNQQLQADNKQLCKGQCLFFSPHLLVLLVEAEVKLRQHLYPALNNSYFSFTELGQLKDTLTVRGEPKAEQ